MINLIMGFRESLEAILIIFIILKIINEAQQNHLKKYLALGTISGVFFSFLVAIILNNILNYAGEQGELLEKIWESSISALAGLLVLSLVYYMIKNKTNISHNIKTKTQNSLHPLSIFFLSLFMIAREGFEIILFVLVNTESNHVIALTGLGIFIGITIGFLIYYSLIKVNLKKIFNITLIYLILQVGYLIGYSVHEFIEVLELKELFLDINFIHGRLYDLSNTFLNHKDRLIGILLNAFTGWTDKPHILQFITQYLVTGGLLLIYKKQKKESN